ncbi:MAG: DUF58 domain-containing protein [Candidatus Altiarchaeales archaeon]|nr:MAG: DUF58 domain-containing protein [Candidatus Altiarchaeales archaeon]RLI93802.1 MAG: DUF58 domain-containing protein [Candidatus Altiarchaeales archaeon]RLI94173.1 MAG: DUF58 domain-containing protein [Candidatus Altiarchaeales archaeon]HDO82229.1 DUF58 domain-containing protein [Candidatus Altiarchaeales archaeon]HEX54878.1 DUF58 domain-containing protein [Candidatus Altiarchaeales archaeon]
MVIDPSFIEQLKKLNITTKRRVVNVYMGSRPSIRQGRGIEIADYREYYPGDDFRSIDWRVYARTERLYIRRFEEEKDLILHLLLDSSASMDFAVSGIMRKFDYAGSIAAGFAYLALNKNEKFAFALFSDRIREVMQARKSTFHFFKLVDLINSSPQSGKTNLKKCVDQYTNLIKARSFIIVISDFIEPIESLEYGIYKIAKYSKEAILVQILDPGEINLQWRDDIKFEDMETSETERTFLSPEFKREYSEKLEQHIFEIREICNDTGVDFFSVTTNMPLFDAFVEILRHRS